MFLILVSLGCLVCGGLLSLVLARLSRHADVVGAASAVAGCGFGLAGSFGNLNSAATVTFRLPWAVPFGSMCLRLDALSAFFLTVVFLTCGVAAVYGFSYLRGHGGGRSHGLAWFLFNLLVAAMALVLLAFNGILFLVAWEIMSLASFFLVTLDDEREETRRAGWIYLVATHLGTACLLAMFALLGGGSANLDFDRMGPSAGAGTLQAGALFVLALIGFGTKAGFVPLHVWLPEAHPAAPSHVSAVMSGVMIKTGIYGLLRIVTLIGPPPVWWGLALVGVGLTSGILGVLYALAQHDLKRLLAYSSVENIGIIALGLGIGLIGISWHSEPMIVLGLAGGLLHVLNHAVFKSLLFFGAGSVLIGTGTREIDHTGGLLKRMPWTAATFVIGAVAISGLPPLNGFISEFLIYVGAFKGIQADSGAVVLVLVAAGAGLALIGGLAAACFSKAFGIVFLGEPRSLHAARAHESPWPMRFAMLVQAALCMLIAVCAPLLIPLLAPVVASVSGVPVARSGYALAHVVPLMTKIVLGTLLLSVIAVGLMLLRRRLLAGRQVCDSVTWDCGYAEPTARMQYTASSFAQPLVDLFGMVLRTRRVAVLPKGHFPDRGSLSTETPDVFIAGGYRPMFRALAWLALRLRWIQHGRLQLYVLYIAVTLLVLLFWKLG